MQEGTVEWDPQYLVREPGWALRLYVFYLLFAFCYALVKAVAITYKLWVCRVEVNEPTATDSAENFARSAIRGKSLRQIGNLAANAKPLLEFLAANLDADVRRMMRCSVITVMAASCIFTVGLGNSFLEIARSKSAGIGAMGAAATDVLISSSMGLVLGIGIYFIASVFEGRLARNRAKWNLFYATSKEC